MTPIQVPAGQSYSERSMFHLHSCVHRSEFFLLQIFHTVAYPVSLTKAKQDFLILRLGFAAVSAPVGFAGVSVCEEQRSFAGSAENGSRTAPALDILRIIGSGRNLQRRSAGQCADDLRVVFSMGNAVEKPVKDRLSRFRRGAFPCRPGKR